MDGEDEQGEELDRLRGEVARLEGEALDHHAEMERMRAAADDDARHIGTLRADADESAKVERSQHALIDQLRADLGHRADEAASIGDALQRAERELVDLRAIRDALTPPLTVQRPGVSIASEFVPASREVSGDFFFVGDGPEDELIVVVGDVVGKGLGAARRAAFTRTAFASVAGFSQDPCQLLEWVNVALVERAADSADFVTAVCITYQPAQRTLRWAYAGHPHAMSLRDGTPLVTGRTGLPLGVAPSVGCGEGETQLQPGDGVLLFTDGLTEAARDRADLYGTDRIAAAIRRHASSAPDALLQHLRDDATTHAHGDLGDDLCLVAFRVDP